MASCYAGPSTLSTWIGDEDEVEKESGDESDESEPEQTFVPVVRRKVSFADAFGLDLVSIKEFDNRIENAERREGEEYYLSCIFSVPTSDEELELRLQQDKLELESIELLPGSSTIRGTVRVLNLSYHKVVYVRTTLDGWQNYFDQLADYVPGSSNGVTDRFSFQLTLMPPFPPDGARVEFCLCYESSAGIFWANSGGMNYVLFCHQRAGRALKEKEGGKEREAEENNQKGKKSCLKAIKKGTCAELKSMDMSIELSEQESYRSTENKEGTTLHNEQCRSGDTLEESCKTL
ncbi:protein phosphatase 1 regulatory subunit 3A, partial [Clarias magur]